LEESWAGQSDPVKKDGMNPVAGIKKPFYFNDHPAVDDEKIKRQIYSSKIWWS